MSAPGAGFHYPPQHVSWMKRDVLLFAHSIGCTVDELHFLYVCILISDHPFVPNLALGPAFKRTDQEVIDFYSRSSDIPISGVPKFDHRRLVDGQRRLTFFKPLSPSSHGRAFEVRSKVLGAYGKGNAGSVVETETVLAERGGDEYTRAVGSAFFVGQGSWGGPKGKP
ncbi:MAG: hypothetical protein Q9194_001337 [Teloschistes cf. exilis]